MKKLFLVALLVLAQTTSAMAVTSGPTSCPAGTTRTGHSGSGRGGGYHITYICVPNSCKTPWGTTVASGNSYVAYQSATVAYPNTCVSETVSCSYGQLSANLGYTNPTCTETIPNIGGDGPNGN
jgi:hypothetical protein